jgi:hypothetical protein
VLIDFGAVREADTQQARAKSTLRVVKDGYSPQELYIDGSEQGPWSDIYGLGATFCMLISGEAPPNSQMRLAAAAAGLEDPYIPLEGRIEGYEPVFLAAIDKALALLPKHRLQSTKDWLAMIAASNDATRIVPLPLPATDAGQAKDVAAPTRTGKAVGGGFRLGRMLAGGIVALALVSVAGLFLGAKEEASVVVEARPSGDPALLAETFATPAGADGAGSKPAEDVASAVETAMVELSPVASPRERGVPLDLADPEPPPTELVTEIMVASPVMSNWLVEVPFTIKDGDAALIDSVAAGVPDWLRPELTVVAVNGTPVRTAADVLAAARRRGDPGEAATVAIAFAVTDKPDAAPVERTIELPVLQDTMLLNGVLFQGRFVDGAWQTIVKDLPLDYAGDLDVGDILVAHAASGEQIRTRMKLKEILDAEIALGTPEPSFFVQRDGKIWMTSFPIIAQ